MNVYSEPEHFNLRTIGEVEFTSGCYEFDTTVVWQDVDSGALYFADDSGCSCPVPFESTNRSTMTRIDRLQTLIDHLEARKKDFYGYGVEWYPDETARIDGDCGALILKVQAVTS